MFVVFTSPIQFTKSYNKAVQIADDYFTKTGNIVAVETVDQQETFHVPSVNQFFNQTIGA